MSEHHIKEFENHIPEKVYIEKALNSNFSYIDQENPFDSKEFCNDFIKDVNAYFNKCKRKRIKVTVIIAFKGLDIHKIPWFELSNNENGPCYVLCCLKSENEYGNFEKGDKVVVEGNFLTVHEKYGIVLKSCTRIN